ncbi:hypothetical protein MN1_420 [Thermus phage MN1]|nr:hypothetical protein MN1_420 [Thermus phage MN1]
MGMRRMTLDEAIAQYGGWVIYDSDGDRRRLLLLLAPGESPDDLSRAVLLIVEGAWATVWPVTLSPTLGLKPQGRWTPHGRWA